jgi:hypothetical protein
MDLAIIHSIKSNYRLKLAQKLLALLDSKSNPTVKHIDLNYAQRFVGMRSQSKQSKIVLLKVVSSLQILI